jgi:hypothetical protein
MCPFLLQTLCTQRMHYNGETTIRNSKLTQMSQNISFDLRSYRNHGRLNFHVSINLRVLGLLGVALTRVDAFFGGFGLTG